MDERRDRREYDARLTIIYTRIKRLERSIYGFMGMLVLLNFLWAIPMIGEMFS